MAEPELSILLSLKDEATSQLQNFNKAVEDNAAQIKTASLVMIAFGAAITAALGIAVKEAESDREANARLSTALKNIGVDYGFVKSQIDGLVNAQVKTTNYSKTEQTDALNKLIIFTKDYRSAIAALPVALDLAAAENIDLAAASKYVGDAFDGNSTRLKTLYGIDIPQGVLGLQALKAIEDQVKDAAINTASPFILLGNNIKEMAGAIGTLLLPTLTYLIEKFVNVIGHIQAWVELHPRLAECLVIAAAGFGALATAIGLAALAMMSQFIPALVRVVPMIWGAVIATWSWVAAQIAVLAAMGPVGWGILAGGVIAAAGAVYGITRAVGALTAPIETAMPAASPASAPALTSGERRAAALSTREVHLTPYQYGGTVPGPIGQPIPIIAHGGERYLGVGAGGGGNTYNFNIGGSILSESDATNTIRRLMLLVKDRNYNAGLT